MTVKYFCLAALIIAQFAFIGQGMAQDAKEVPEKPASVIKKPADKTAGPSEKLPEPVKKWIDAENALIDTLSEKDKESFFILRNKYSVIRVIDVVERDVGTAVSLCGQKNPSMKGKMDTRFAEWKSAVDPIIVTASKTLDRELKAQKIVDEAQARNIFKLNDEAYAYGEKAIKKVPLTKPDACNSLLRSMDSTEDEMVTLLQKTLLPESVIRRRDAAPSKAGADADIKNNAPKSE